MSYTERVPLILPNGIKKNGSDVFNILDPDSGGAGTFAVPLSADGLQPVTYWGAYTQLLDTAYNALANMTVTQFKTYIDQESTRLGRTPVGSITAFKSGLIMGAPGGDFWALVAAQGLKRVNGTA